MTRAPRSGSTSRRSDRPLDVHPPPARSAPARVRPRLLRLRRAHRELHPPPRAAGRQRGGDHQLRAADQDRRRVRPRGLLQRPPRHVRAERDAAARRAACRSTSARSAPTCSCACRCTSSPGSWCRSTSCSARACASTSATATTRSRYLDALFLARLDDALSPVPSITRALARLRASEGRVPIGALAGELGCSPRHLNRHFRDQVGVTPKLFARILRFQHAIALIDREPSWASIAQHAGYYDQAHLVRDFQQFAGASPTEFTRLRLPDGGGVRDGL